MRRLIVILSVLVASLSFTAVAQAKSGCVLTREGHVICGTIVPRGYRPPPVVMHRAPVVVQCRRGYTMVRGVCVVSRPAPRRGAVVCARGFERRGTVCVRVRRY